jgi:DNA-binding GntR family transcriptional regulator
MAQPRNRTAAKPTRARSSGTSALASKTKIDLGVKTYKGAIYDALAEMIAELELPPGSRLIEAELAARFQVSKTPIREVLLLLEGDGLVELEPYVGASVTWLSVDEWEEMLFIFDALEQPALKRVSDRITPSEIAAVQRLVDRLARRRAERQSLAYATTMRQLHRQLFAPTGYPRLLEMINRLLRGGARRYQRIFVHAFDDAWDTELGLIRGRFEGIARGDPEAAAAAVAGGHAELVRLARQRTDDPRVSPFLGP